MDVNLINDFNSHNIQKVSFNIIYCWLVGYYAILSIIILLYI